MGKEVLEVQNCARLNMLQRETTDSIQIYKDARKEARKVCRRKKTSRRRTVRIVREILKKKMLKIL
jgi:hypothetical protein